MIFTRKIMPSKLGHSCAQRENHFALSCPRVVPAFIPCCSLVVPYTTNSDFWAATQLFPLWQPTESPRRPPESPSIDDLDFDRPVIPPYPACATSLYAQKAKYSNPPTKSTFVKYFSLYDIFLLICCSLYVFSNSNLFAFALKSHLTGYPTIKKNRIPLT